jgi:hypothetical protein
MSCCFPWRDYIPVLDLLMHWLTVVNPENLRADRGLEYNLGVPYDLTNSMLM